MIGCLVIAGCGTFSKQSNGKAAPGPAAPAGDPRMPWPPPPAGKTPPPAGQPGAAAPAGLPSVTTASASGILAGQILDGFNRRPPAATFIQVSPNQEGDRGAPIDVAA